MDIFVLSLAISLFTTFISLSSSACSLANGNEELAQLSSHAKDIEKSTQIEMAKNYPAEFCERNLSLRYLNANHVDTPTSRLQCNEMNPKELSRILDQTFAASDDQTSWSASVIPTMSAQNHPLILSSGVKADQNTNLQDAVYKKGLVEIQKTLESPPKMTFQGATLETVEAIPKDKIPGNVAKTLLCADLSLSNSFGCRKALSHAIEIATPVKVKSVNSGLLITPAKAWRTVIQHETKYAEGLRLAAITMIQELKDGSKKTSNVFADLKKSFEKTGMTKTESEDAAFNTLALYGNGGANLGARARALCTNDCKAVPGIPYYLEIIGKAIPRLDFQRSQAKQPLYSWPDGVTGRCNSQKSYHFWMAAYLSRELVKQGNTPKAAEIATYAASVGYQLNREQGRIDNRKNVEKSINRPSFDPVVNVIRADLAYSAGGAAFGSNYSDLNPKTISIDNSLLRLIEKAPSNAISTPVLELAPLQPVINYSRFRELLAPSAALEQ